VKLKRTLRYALVVGGAVIGILLYLLAAGSENSEAFDRHYPWLLALNAAVAIALLVLVVVLLGRLFHNYRSGKFGSRLMTRLVLLFAVIGVLPGIVIYLVSVQFVSRSIESWFDVRVESALESGLNLSRAALDSSLAELQTKAKAIASELADAPDVSQITHLARLRNANQTYEATVVTSNGRILANVGGGIGELLPDLPTKAMLNQASTSSAYAIIESGTESRENNTSKVTPSANLTTPQDSANNLRLRVVVTIPPPNNALSLRSEARFLQLLQMVPTQLAVNAEALRAANTEYHERSLGRSGLRKIYIVTLTLTLLLTIFGAVVSAFLIAGDLAKPLLLLAEGTRAVAEGNFSPRPIVATSDELGTLTQSFNTMTKQLYEARTAVEKNRAELENAKAYLESVLANMSAGVMVFDGQFKIVTCNESVERILQHDFDQYIGTPLTAINGLLPFAHAITKGFTEQSAQSAAGANSSPLHWQKQIEIPRALESADNNTETDANITLLARGSHLPVSNGNGYVVVFDDISDVISAQRSIAWGEVARRLAHEIKNPLTPIQLSAERLQMKLENKLEAADSAVLNKCTQTIVNQVAAMKRMVDDFRDYAKTPPAVLSPLYINALIKEILNLYISGDENDIIHANLAADLPKVMGDATQLRQVIHNLLQNAQDAVADRHVGAPAPRIDISSEEIHFRSADGFLRTAVRMSITDNGPGFAPKILARAFEPYVTSKPRGTGLGLAMVRKIIDEHGGRIDIQNRSDENGAKIVILLLKLAPVGI
jgi:nitrogen fixation/metabolism regulation signal transduction histidine kinase